MWVLTTDVGATVPSYFILRAGEHAIGRTATKPEGSDYDGWISFPPPQDKSISRIHAVISVHPLDLNDLQHVDKTQNIFIRDTSKFGVFINGCEPLDGIAPQSASGLRPRPDNDVQLRDGCVIKIGVNNSRLRLENRVLGFCYSKMDKVALNNLRSSCAIIGAHVLNVWNEHCSYLVMNKVEMTHKLLHALIDQRDFILPSFVDSITARPRLQDPLPSVTSRSVDNGQYLFVPPLGDSIQDSWKRFLLPSKDSNPDHMPARRNILQGFTFVQILKTGEPSAASKLDQGVIEHAKGRVKVISIPTDLAAVRGLLSEVTDSCSAFAIEPQAYAPEMASALGELEKRGISVIQMSTVYDVIITCDIGALDPRRAASPASCAADVRPAREPAVPRALPAPPQSLPKPVSAKPELPSSARRDSNLVSQDLRRLVSSTQLVSLSSRCEGLDSAPPVGTQDGPEGVPDTQPRPPPQQRPPPQPRPTPRDPSAPAAGKAEGQGGKPILDSDREAPADALPSKRPRIAARAPEQEQSTAASAAAAARPAHAQAEPEALPTRSAKPRVDRLPAAADGGPRVVARLPPSDDASQAAVARARGPAAGGQGSLDGRSAARPHAQAGAFNQQPRPQWPVQRPPPQPRQPAAGEYVEPPLRDEGMGEDAMSGHATAGPESRPAAKAPPPAAERGGEVVAEGEWTCCTSQEALARTSGDPAVGTLSVAARRTAGGAGAGAGAGLNVKRFRGKDVPAPSQSRRAVTFEVYQGDKATGKVVTS